MNDSIRRFNQLFKEMDDLYRQAAKASGLSESVFWILYMLREKERPLTQHELCDFIMQPKQTISTALQKMEAEGWIIQSCDPADRRRRLILLTKAGLAAASQTADRMLAAEEAAFARFAPDEAENLLRLIEQFNKNIRHEFRGGTA